MIDTPERKYEFQAESKEEAMEWAKVRSPSAKILVDKNFNEFMDCSLGHQDHYELAEAWCGAFASSFCIHCPTASATASSLTCADACCPSSCFAFLC